MKLFVNMGILFGAAALLLGSGCQTTQTTNQPAALMFPADRSIGWLALRNPAESDNAWSFGGFPPENASTHAQGPVALPAGAQAVLELDAETWLDLSPLAQLHPDALYRLIISDQLSANYRTARSQERGPLDAGAPYIARLTGLESLVLNSEKIRGPELAFLPNLRQLKTLSLVAANLQPGGLAPLAGLPSLEGLRIYSEQGYTAADLRGLQNLPKLTTLYIGGNYQPGAFPMLGNLTQLEKLTLNSETENPDGFGALENLQNLRRLNFAPSEYKADDLAFLPKLGNLEALGLRYILNDSAKVAAVARAQSPKELTLMDISEGTSLAPLGAMPQLETLALLRSALTDEMIAGIGTLPNLRAIALAPERFGSLPGITDRTLEMLGRMPTLESIELPFGRYTDGGLRNLFGLKHLKRLNFANNDRFTDNAINSFVWMQNLEELELRAEPFSMAALSKLYQLPRLQKLTLHFPSPEQKKFMQTFNASRRHLR